MNLSTDHSNTYYIGNVFSIEPSGNNFIELFVGQSRPFRIGVSYFAEKDEVCIIFKKYFEELTIFTETNKENGHLLVIVSKQEEK